MRRRTLLAICASPLTAPFVSRAQQQARFSVEVRVVDILATVRGQHHEIVRGLVKADFIVEEEGRPQTVAYFSEESEEPLTLGLLVDSSASQWNIRQTERTASLRLLENVLREDKDVAFVMRFDRGVEVLGSLSSARPRLETALGLLDESETPAWRAEHPNAPPGFRFGATRLFDAIHAGAQHLAARRGRKAMVLLSDGVDTASSTRPEAAIEAAQRADALVYSVLFSDPHAYARESQDPRKRGREVLKRLSTQTGGSYSEFTNLESVKRIFGRIQQELRHEYSLGYVSDRRDGPPGYRKIRVTTRRQGLTVQARDGYYAQSRAEALARAERHLSHVSGWISENRVTEPPPPPHAAERRAPLSPKQPPENSASRPRP